MKASRRHGAVHYICAYLFSLCRALVDAPEFTRKIVNFKRLSLTDLKVDIPRLASKKVLTAKLAESGERSMSIQLVLSRPSARRRAWRYRSS